MTLQQLRYVAEVERCGSLRKAARNLYVSQPNISKQISLLEAELKITIFLRSAQGIQLTAEGQRLMQYINSILRDAEFITDYFHDALQCPSLAVSAQHFSIASEACCRLLKELDAEYNVYSVSLSFQQTSAIFTNVASQQSELGLAVRDESKAAAFDRIAALHKLEFHVLFEGEVNVFFHRSHPLADRKTVSVSDLADYPCIIYTQDNSAPHFFTEEVGLAEIHPSKLLYLNDLHTSVTAMRFAKAYDIGTGFMPEYLWEDYVAVPLEGRSRMSVGYLQLKNTQPSELALRFIKLMKQCIDESRRLIIEKGRI